MAKIPLDRLKAQLLASGLQQQNFPLYQIINELIKAISSSIDKADLALSHTGSGGPTGIDELIPGSGIEIRDMPGGKKVISSVIPFGDGGGDSGEDGPPGPPGKDGPIGPVGPAGSNAESFFYAFDGIDGEDGQPGITGPQGIAGISGSVGPPGIPGTDGIDGEDGMDGIPGLQGPQGPAGGGASATTIEVNLSATATCSGKFTITDAAITSAKKILCWQAPGPYTGKGTLADEAELQPVSVIAVNPLTGSAIVYWQTPPMITNTKNPQSMFLTSGGTVLASPKDPQGISSGVAKRIGRVRGNVKFSYLVIS